MSKNKWKIVSDVFVSGVHCEMCHYASRGYDSETGGWRECILLDEGTSDPELCLGFDDLRERCESKRRSLPEASEVHQVLSTLLKENNGY